MRSPSPYDLVIGGDLGLMVGRPKTGNPRRPLGDAAIEGQFEATAEGATPGTPVEAIYDSWAGGAGYSRKGPDGTYSHAKFVTCRGPYPMPAGELTEVAPSGGWPSGSYGVASEVFGGDLFFATAGREVYRVPSGSGTPVVGATLPVGWAGETDCIAVFGGNLYVGTSLGLARWSGSTWTTTTSVPRRKLATLYWVVAGVGSWQLLGTNAANTGFYRVSADPMVGANWSSLTFIGDVSYPIASLATSNRTIFFVKTNGVHSVDARGYTPNLTPHWQRAYSADNGVAATVYEGRVIASHHEGIEAVNVADAARVDVPQWIDPNHYLPNDSPFNGLPVAYVNERGWLGVAYYNANTDRSYIGYGRAGEQPGGGPFVWHFWEAEVAGRVTHLRLASPGGAPRLWIWAREGSTPKLYWQSLWKSANAYQDWLEGGPMRFHVGGELVQSREDFTRGGDPKTIYRYHVVSENLAGGRSLALSVATEGGPFNLQGNATRSPRTTVGPTDAEERAHEIQVRTTFNGSADEPAILHSIEAEAELNPDQVDVRRYPIVFGIGTKLNTGAFDDKRSPGAVLSELEALQTDDPVELIDNIRDEELVVKIRGAMQTRIVEDSDESGNRRGWSGSAVLTVAVLARVAYYDAEDVYDGGATYYE